MTTVISVENLSKSYRLGQITGRTLTQDFNRWWARVRNQPDPYQKIDHVEQGNREGEEIWALKDVSFTVGQGEVLGIIGRNGAGKSTLLKILSRVTAPTSGLVKIKGRIASLLEVGTGFHPELTGRENVYLNGAILGMTRREVDSKFDEIVEFAEVEKFIDTPVKRYSSGMYVRLAFAVAAHLEPEILVVDEVLAVGDSEFQKKCLGKMDDVAHQGRTVLFVSHNMGAVRQLCQRGIVLSSGIKVIDAGIDHAIESYVSTHLDRNSPSIDLPQYAKNYYGENIGYGTKLSFFSSTGKPKIAFKLGEEIRIVLEFEVKRSLRKAIAAVGIRTADGIPIVTYWSRPKAIKQGMYQVSFLCDIKFNAIGLSLIVGLSENDRTFYYLENAASITIADIAEEDQPYGAGRSGLLLGEMTEEIQPVA